MMTPELEKEYFDFVNQLGVERSLLTGTDDPHTEEMSFVLLHMILGLVTESGEVADIAKKHMAYKRPLDTNKLRDELGDVLFYLCGALIELGSSLDEIVNMNVAKLKARYPGGYSHHCANNRDAVVEEKAQSDAPLSGLTQLTRLSLSRNQISDVSPLSGLTQLTELDLSDNPISNE